MIGISAQVSLYPLGQEDIAPAIDAVVGVLAERGIAHEVGAMSTTLRGEDEAVFAALREAFRAAAAFGQAVMTVTVSNACPLPPASGRPGDAP